MECYYESNNLFVAGFIGELSMNSIQCSRDGQTLSTGKYDYQLSKSTVKILGSKTEFTLGIWPEDVEVVQEPMEKNDILVEVDVIEPFGKENNLYLVPNLEPSEDAVIATVDGRKRINSGQAVGMRFPEDHIHLFDREDGTALRHPVVEKRELDQVVE